MLSSWRATVTHGEQPDLHDISIHALLAESDAQNLLPLLVSEYFYPRSWSPCRTSDNWFLSTLSLRRATWRQRHFSCRRNISIHALLAESDCFRRLRWPCRPYFYPRSPCGERPQSYITDTYNLLFLSTLSLRRATLPVLSALFAFTYFYPRSPCGERLLL